MSLIRTKSLLFREFYEYDTDFYIFGNDAPGFPSSNAETEFREQRAKTDGITSPVEFFIANNTGIDVVWHMLYVGGIRCAERCSITVKVNTLTTIGTYANWDFGRGQFVLIIPETVLGFEIHNGDAMEVIFNTSSAAVPVEVGIIRLANHSMNIQNQIPCGLEYSLNPVCGIEKFETPGGNVYTSENYVEKYKKQFSFDSVRASEWTKFLHELRQKRVSETSLMILNPSTDEQAAYSACFGKITDYGITGSLKANTKISGQITMQEQ